MGQKKTSGYIAIARTIFEHPLLKNPKWHIGWEWLIAHAAWEASKGARLSRGVTELKRGEIAVTIRGLAESWKWSRGSVEHFLKKLEAAGMVTRRAIKTSFQTSSKTGSSYGATVLTICNYDKFQTATKSSRRGLRQDLRQDLGQLSFEDVVMQSISDTNHLNQSNNKSLESGGKKLLHKPKHLTVSRDGKWLWTDYGTAEWDDYAADWQDVRGTVKLPENYIEGRGFWFYKAGATSAPKEKRRRA